MFSRGSRHPKYLEVVGIIKAEKMAKQSLIAIVGSANVDLTTFNDVFPRPGETIFGKKFDLGFFGPATIKNFESLGIDATYVRVADGVSSGVAPIFVDSSGQNRIIVVKGANDTLSPEDVDAAGPLLRKADAIILQFEIPLRTVYHTVRFAGAHGIRCIVNPAPAQAVDFEQVAAADYFIPNESEAETITGMPAGSIDEAQKCAEFLLRQGLQRVIITLGERGCLAAEPGRMELIAAFKVQAVDTTGAGDAFIGSFAVFLGEGLPEKEALQRANLYAALSTTRVGTQKSFCNRDEFERERQNRVGRL
jgi:ribokinase